MGVLTFEYHLKVVGRRKERPRPRLVHVSREERCGSPGLCPPSITKLLLYILVVHLFKRELSWRVVELRYVKKYEDQCLYRALYLF